MYEAKTHDIADGGAASLGGARISGKSPAKLPVCIVLHQEHSNPGHVGQWFIRNGHALDIRRPRFGDPLPTTSSIIVEPSCSADP